MAGGQASSQGQSGMWVDGKTQQGLNPAVGEHKGLKKDNALGCLAEWEASLDANGQGSLLTCTELSKNK